MLPHCSYDPEYGEFIPIQNIAKQRSLGPGHAMMQVSASVGKCGEVWKAWGILH